VRITLTWYVGGGKKELADDKERPVSWATAATTSELRTRITVMYFNKSYSDFLSRFFGGAEASHCKVGWPSPLTVASKILSRKTERNRLRAFSNRFPMSGLLFPSIESPSGGPEKVSSRQIDKYIHHGRA